MIDLESVEAQNVHDDVKLLMAWKGQILLPSSSRSGDDLNESWWFYCAAIDDCEMREVYMSNCRWASDFWRRGNYLRRLPVLRFSKGVQWWAVPVDATPRGRRT